MKTYNLFLDDERVPLTAFNYTGNDLYRSESWKVVRTYESFVSQLKLMKHFQYNPKIISFDHDLADEHYQIGQESGFTQFDYSKAKEKTGLDCAKFMCDFFHQHKIPFPTILIHSMNPVGRENIEKYILNFIKHNG